MTQATVRLAFFEFVAELRTNVPALADYCRELFAAFVDAPDRDAQSVPPADAPAGSAEHTSTATPYRLEILERPDRTWVVRDPWIVDAVVRRPEWLPGIVAARLLEAAGNGVEGRFLFHAASVARGEDGLILAGESGFGKSTLAMALVARRGWQLLSDEVAVLDARDGSLLPFPKAIELHPATAARLGLPSSSPSSRTAPGSRGGKRRYDLSRTLPSSVARPCVPRAVVLIEPAAPPAEGPRPGSASTRTVRVRTHEREEAVVPEIARLDGVLGARWDDAANDPPPELVLDIDPSRFAAFRLEDVLGRHGLLVVASSFDVEPPRDFDRPVRLEPLATHAGVAALLARFRGSRAAARHVEAHGGFGDLFVALVERLAGTRFFRMSPGRLEESLTALETACAGSPEPATGRPSGRG